MKKCHYLSWFVCSCVLFISRSLCLLECRLGLSYLWLFSIYKLRVAVVLFVGYFVYQIEGISWLTFPHNMYAWSGWPFLWFIMVFWIVGIRGNFSSCEDMYRFIIIHGYGGWFGIQIMLRIGHKFAKVCVVKRLPRNACLLWTSLNSPPLWPLRHSLVYSYGDVMYVYYKKLRYGNKSWMCLANLVAISLIPCIKMIARGVREHATRCKHGKEDQKVLRYTKTIIWSKI